MKYFFKFILSLLIWLIYWISAFLSISLLILISLVVPKKAYNPLVKLACVIMMYSAFIFPRHRGIKPEKVPYPVIYVANHVSFFDLFVSGTVLPGYPRGVEIKAHFSKPIYGWFITRFGEIPIDPSSKASIKKSFQEAETILKEKIRSILFMPEGHRTRTGKLQNFRYGAFHLSRSSGIPVVPVVYKGLYQRNNATSLLIKPGFFDVIILEPVYPEKFDSEEKMAEHVRQIMIKKLEERT